MLSFYVLVIIILFAPSYDSVVPMALGFAILIITAAVRECSCFHFFALEN